MSETAVFKRKSCIAEIIGPAGAGKTTIIRALSQTHHKIRPDFHPSRISQFPFFLQNTFSLLPTYLRHYRGSRWFSRRETRSMAYLKAGLLVLGQQPLNSGTVTLLDHGPIYRLAFLRALGPEITKSEPYERWWAGLLDRWVGLIDVVIWLDAPNDILLERIRARDSWHTIKERCELEAFEYLDHYRSFLKQILAESLTDRHVTLLRFDTNQKSIKEMINRILVTFDSATCTS